ncbi:Protein BCL9 like, partial [Pseudolycoriella hygida]
MIKEKPDRFASTSSATTSAAATSITPPLTTSSSSPTTPGTAGTVSLSQSASDGAINSSALSKSPGTTSSTGGGSSGSPSATKATTNSSNATGINTTNSSTVPNNSASGVSPQSSSSSSSNSNTKHSPTHQLSKKEKDGQTSITPTVSSLLPTIKDEPITSDPLMGNGDDMCALQADQIKRESDSGSSTTSSSTLAGNLKDNARLGKNGIGATGIIGSTNTGSVPGGYEKTNRSPLSEARIKEELTSLSGGPQTCNLSLVKMEASSGSESIDFQSQQQITPMDQVSNRVSGDGNSPADSNLGNTNATGQPGQPVPSNVMSKQSGGMEYMQTQNHIFVFSTSLANKSAEAVMTRQYASIIAYHCAQPGSKKFLEKHPLKQSQFQRQNPAQWLNNISVMKSKSNIRGPVVGGNNSGGMAMQQQHQQQSHMSGVGFQAGGSTGSIQDDMMSNPDNDLLSSWDDASSHHNIGLDVLSNGNTNTGPPNTTTSSVSIASSTVASAASLLSDSTGLDNLVPGSPLSGRIGSNNLSLGPIMQQPQQSPTAMVNSGPGSLGSTSPGLGGMTPSLQGVKVPDANLTPQQRQHREEQLAKLKQMNTLLFPEQMPSDCLISDADQEGAGSGGPPPCKMHLSAPPGASRGASVPNMGGGPAGQMSGGPGCTQMAPNMSPSGPMGGMPFNNMSMMPGMNNSGAINDGPHCIPGGMMHQSNVMGVPGSGPHQQMIGNMNMNMGGPRAHLSQQQQQQLQQQQMMGGMNSCMLPMGPGGMMNQKQMMGGPGGQTVQAQMEWNKLQHQFFEERKGDDHRMDGGRGGHMQSERDRIHGERMFQMNLGGPPMPSGMMPGNRQMSGSIRHPNHPNQQQQFQQHHQQGSRLQGPPPPYHQTQRSASVPIATQSPNPSSPTNNPTSNLSLPSPRAGSALNSPAADHTRQQQPSFKHLGQSPTSIDSPVPQQRPVNHSNPSTPISSHLSPNASLKDLELATSQHIPGKEPNLMPVPSPQQIQYLNTFEGQELTIQKQANTSLKDSNNMTGQQQQHHQTMQGGHAENRLSGSNTPLTPSGSIEP